MGEARNDEGRLVSVLRWCLGGDNIGQNEHALVRHEFVVYAIERELKNVRDLPLEVADQPGVETDRKHVRDALDQRIKGSDEALHR